MTKYRRSRDAAAGNPWHFCRDCSDDPKDNYEVRYDQPRYSELCHQCKTGRLRPSSMVQTPMAHAVCLEWVPNLEEQAFRPKHSIAATQQIRVLSTDQVNGKPEECRQELGQAA